MLVNEPGFMEATTHTASPIIADVDPPRCTTPRSGLEKENQYLLVITASLEQLSLGPGGDNPKKSTTNPPRGNMFQNPQMAAIFSGSTREVSYGGATMKELKEWGGKWTSSKK